jgi:hypothetical protein
MDTEGAKGVKTVNDEGDEGDEGGSNTIDYKERELQAVETDWAKAKVEYPSLKEEERLYISLHNELKITDVESIFTDARAELHKSIERSELELLAIDHYILLFDRRKEQILDRYDVRRYGYFKPLPTFAVDMQARKKVYRDSQSKLCIDGKLDPACEDSLRYEFNNHASRAAHNQSVLHKYKYHVVHGIELPPGHPGLEYEPAVAKIKRAEYISKIMKCFSDDRQHRQEFEENINSLHALCAVVSKKIDEVNIYYAELEDLYNEYMGISELYAKPEIKFAGAPASEICAIM